MSSSERAAELLKLDLFAVLGVSRTANAEEIKKGYFAVIKQFHPDRAPSDQARPMFTKAFGRIELAKATLMDPTRRQRYLDELKGAPASDRSTAAEASFEFAKAQAYLKTNDRVRAEQHARKAVALAPDHVDYAVLLVSVRVTTDATPEKLRELALELDGLIARSPDLESALLQRGLVRKRLNRTDEAMADFKRVAELNPSNIEAVREVRIHRMRTGEKSAAESEPKGIGGAIKRLFRR